MAESKHLALPAININTKNFQTAAIDGGKIALALVVGTAGAQKFLNLEEIAKKFNINVDPSTLTGKIVAHQGAVKVIGGAFVLYKYGKKMPNWAKWLTLAVMLQGGLQEANVLSGNKAGNIGDVNDEMEKMAKEIKEGMSGSETQENNTGVAGSETQEPNTGVAGMELESGTSVAGGDDQHYFADL